VKGVGGFVISLLIFIIGAASFLYMLISGRYTINKIGDNPYKRFSGGVNV